MNNRQSVAKSFDADNLTIYLFILAAAAAATDSLLT